MIKKIQTYIHQVFDLSMQIAKAEFKLKNEGSYLGIFWYLLNPLLTFGLLFFIFADRLGNNIPNYALYLIIGVILFNFFQATTLESIKSLIKENNILIKSINFPKETLVLSIVFKNLISHFFEILLLSFILFFMHMNLIWVLYYIPILFFLSLFTFGISLLLSSLTVFFVDLDNVWSFAVRLIWLGTPIFYAIANQTRLFYLNLINPLYYFITITRNLLIYHTIPQGWLLGGAFIFTLLSLLAGLIIFKNLNKKITELI